MSYQDEYTWAAFKVRLDFGELLSVSEAIEFARLDRMIGPLIMDPYSPRGFNP